MRKYGLHNRLVAHPGRRDALVQIMIEAAALVKDAPGCELYFVGISPREPDVLWVTEVWTREQDHQASLKLPRVRALIERGRPLVAVPPDQTVTDVVGGKGV
jgi:quinol monooxygenase YgiN